MANKTIGRYTLVDIIGRGGMAVVYRAFDPRFKRDVAIKVMTQDLLDDPKLIARFEREAQTIAALEHPAIVPVYDFGEESRRPYLVMRLMTGGTLSDRLKQGAIPIAETVEILDRIGSALERAHARGVIHRDLKPSNIMFDDYGDAFLADFGIARLTESAMTLTGDSVIGTPSYMSPEQIHGDREIDGRSDIYALGIICFEMLTGKRPYEDKTAAKIMMRHIMDPVPDIRQARPDLPPAAEEAINRTLAKDPDARYSTAGELAQTLRSLAALESPPPPPIVGPPPPERAPAEPDTETAATGAEAFPETEVMAPSFMETPSPETEVMAPAKPAAPERPAARATPIPAPTAAPAAPAERGGGRRWLIIGAVVAFFGLVMIAAVVAGGIFLFGQDGGEDEEATVAVAAEATQPEEAPVLEDTPELEDTMVPEEEPEPEDRPEPAVDPERFMDEFYVAMDDGDYDRAREAIDQAIELGPEDSWYLHERAWLFSEMGMYEAALEDADRAVALEPDSADNYLRRGFAYRDLGDYDMAVADHERAVELQPDDDNFWAELGISLFEKRELQAALDSFSQAIELNGSESWYYGSRADVFRELGQPEEAVADLEQALALSPGELWHFDQLADVYAWEIGDVEAGLEYINLAIEQAPDEAWRYTNRANMKRELGDLDGAIADYERAIEIDPEDVWLYMEYGGFYRDVIEDKEAALDQFIRATEVDPDFPDAYLARASILAYDYGDYETAIGDASLCAEVAPDFPWCYFDRAWFRNDTGDIDGAVADFQRFIELVPEDDCPECVEDAAAYIEEHR